MSSLTISGSSTKVISNPMNKSPRNNNNQGRFHVLYIGMMILLLLAWTILLLVGYYKENKIIIADDGDGEEERKNNQLLRSNEINNKMNQDVLENEKKQQQPRTENDFDQFIPYPNDGTYPKETLIIKTDMGPIRILLRPDLCGRDTIDYIHQMVRNNICSPCNFYRVEKPVLLQGILANHVQDNIIEPVTMKGTCPRGYEHVDKNNNNCPISDPTCNCHGPVMTYGTVAWAGGATGPDFFINTDKNPVLSWGTFHTVWGQIIDPNSLDIIMNSIYPLPAKPNEDHTSTMFIDKLTFTIQLEKEE